MRGSRRPAAVGGGYTGAAEQHILDNHKAAPTAEDFKALFKTGFE